jgi:sulfate/thiosulfate transport system substrate-binding protein
MKSFYTSVQRWIPIFFWMLLFIYSVWPWLKWKQPAPHAVVFYGFSILGDVMTRSIFPAFQNEWERQTGEQIEFTSSFSGSGTVTNQLIMGVPAQLAVLSLEPDAERLRKNHLISSGDWRDLPHGGILIRTPFIILVRRGNPKHIHDFSDLARSGIKVVHPDPLTSGAANWAILAEYGAGMRKHPNQPDAGYNLLLGIWRNVVAQAHSARSARVQFENGFGDALITYEQEALYDQSQGKLKSDIVYPFSTILSEPVVVVIRRHIRGDEQKLIDALLNFLWSDSAQRLFVSSGFRSVDERLNGSGTSFGKIADPFDIGFLGGWEKAQKEIVDDIWKRRVLNQIGKH